MNRRGFVGAVLGVCAAPLLVRGEEPMRDSFHYRGWSVRWSGWIVPANQDVRVGAWVAFPERWSQGERGRYATTAGMVCRNCGDLDTMDMTCMPGWPRPSGAAGELDTEEKRDAVKRRALNALLEVL